MIEKLLEDWLDSASEKSYQPCFVQMLSGKGFRVLHSTRHCGLEFGKDVIAIAPDGVPCAYQLKGKPGGRLGLAEFRDNIQAQIVQLISQPLVFPGIPIKGVHRSYLVCNGYYDEEVQRAVDDLNRAPYISKIELVSRGDLLDWAKQLGAKLWPSEFSNIRSLLEIFLHNGRDLLPTHRLGQMLEEVLALRTSDEPQKAAELKRAVPSAALLTGIATHQFAEESNHFAMVSAWCLFLINTISACERSNVKLRGKIKEVVDLAELAIKDSLVALWEEVQSQGHLVEGNAVVDHEIYRWRYTLLCGLFSALWFFPENSDEDVERKAGIEEWLIRPHVPLNLWGEGAVSNILANLLVQQRTNPAQKADKHIAHILRLVVDANQQESKGMLPDPYYDYAAIGRVLYGLPSEESSLDLTGESFAGSSYTAELLLHLVARARLKFECKTIWPDFTRLVHKRFAPTQSWQYGLLRCSEGAEESRQYTSEYRWDQLCEDAAQDTCGYLPQELAARPHLLLLWVIIAPHRLTSDIGRFLASKLPG